MIMKAFWNESIRAYYFGNSKVTKRLVIETGAKKKLVFWGVLTIKDCFRMFWEF